MYSNEHKYQNHELNVWNILQWIHFYLPWTNDYRGFRVDSITPRN